MPKIGERESLESSAASRVADGRGRAILCLLCRHSNNAFYTPTPKPDIPRTRRFCINRYWVEYRCTSKVVYPGYVVKTGVRIQKKLEFSFLDVCVGGHDGLWHGDAHGSMWAMGIEMVKLLIG